MNFAKRIGEWRSAAWLLLVAILALFCLFQAPLAGLSWVVRGAVVGTILVAAGTLFYSDMFRQARHHRVAEHYLSLLGRLEQSELEGDDALALLPILPENNPWTASLIRLRDRLIESCQRADVAERAWTRAEVRVRRLNNERSQFAEILDALSQPVIATNQYDELLVANQSARHLLGIELHQDEPIPLENSVKCAELVEMLTQARRRRTSSHRHTEMEMTDQSDKQHWYRLTCRSFGNPAGAETESGQPGAVASLTDISIEKGIQKRHAEFVSAASHEMKAPLSGIRAYVELLLDGEAKNAETQYEFLTVIDTQADRLQRLIENLLNLARIEAGVVNVHKARYSLNEILEEAFQVVLPQAEQKQITLNRELSTLFLGVLVDRDMILQTAINLLSNAIKYTNAGGTVSLRSRMEENAALFEVEDTGVGLSSEDCARIFEKFYRVGKDQKMAAGTGLGLPVAKHIVEDVHGGALSVSSTPDTGSVFRVSLASVRGTS